MHSLTRMPLRADAPGVDQDAAEEGRPGRHEDPIVADTTKVGASYAPVRACGDRDIAEGRRVACAHGSTVTGYMLASTVELRIKRAFQAFEHLHIPNDWRLFFLPSHCWPPKAWARSCS